MYSLAHYHGFYVFHPLNSDFGKVRLYIYCQSQICLVRFISLSLCLFPVNLPIFFVYHRVQKSRSPGSVESSSNSRPRRIAVSFQNLVFSCFDTDNLCPEIQSQPVEVLEPLRLMFEQKIAKTYPMAMNLLQKITQAFQVVEHSTLLLILGILKDASAEFLDEMTEIRVLQMLLTFLDPHTIQLSKEFVTLVMQCCFQMMDTKSLAVKSTIQATLKQLFTIILERFTEGCKEGIPVQQQRDIFSAKKKGVLYTPDEVTQLTDLLRTKF